MDASTFSVAVQQHRRLLGFSGGSEVLIQIKDLPDFHKEMMRLGSTFSKYPLVGAPRKSMPAGLSVEQR